MDSAAAAGETTALFEDLDQVLRARGSAATIEQLIELLNQRGEYRALLDALLLKARHELGLPLIQVGSLADLPEPTRTQFEDQYVAAIRHVGGRLLEHGDFVGAWPYYRAIGEKDPVAAALETYEPSEGDERIGQIIEVAFNQGAHPRKGFALILDHYGACSAITAFEHLPPDDAIRVDAAGKLVAHLHAQLTASIRGDIARQGHALPAEGTSITELIAGREWLFADDAYHIDISHLGSVVRMSTILTDPCLIRLAVELTDYGRHLSDRHKYEGDPPFARLYEDHAIYLRALLGQDVDAAIAHFQTKLPPPDPDGMGDTLPAQILVRLLVRLERHGEAIDISAAHLAGVPDAGLICPSLAQLCERAGRPDRLAQISRERGDLVHYAAAIVQMTKD
jgi:hypothetical protein